LRGNTHRGLLGAPASSDHPRARGEHCSSFGIPSLTNGSSPSGEHSLRSAVSRPGIASSPRTRRTRGLGTGEQVWDRSIPAHAGNTALVSECHPRRTVYPRAGNRGPWRRRVWSSPAHPRARGEHTGDGVPTTVINGSSRVGSIPAISHPIGVAAEHRRARGGTLIGEPVDKMRERSIPAHAGNTPRRSRASPWTAGHPRHMGNTLGLRR
jgi:hypothetical protein